jgi:hypothetical protein
MSHQNPQLYLDGVDEYAETYVNPQPSSSQPEEDGLINANAIEKLEVRYCDRMPQLPKCVAYYTLDFGKNKLDSMWLYTVTFSNGEVRRYAGYPPTPNSQLLEKLFLNATRHASSDG